MPYFAHVFEGEENVDAVSIIFYNNKSRCKAVTDKPDSSGFSVMFSDFRMATKYSVWSQLYRQCIKKSTYISGI